MKIYLAGKIEERCWRHAIVKGLADVFSGCVDEMQNRFLDWPILSKSIFGVYDYVGPYFAGSDHGSYHGENTHGLATFLKDNHGCWGENGFPGGVRDACLKAIVKAELVFAWIDCATCFGTLVEIGYAHGLKKSIWIAGNDQIQDLWFMYLLAEKTLFQESADELTPGKALQEMLYSDLRRMPYPEFLKTDYWKATRTAALERASHRCQLCNSKGPVLNVHHRTYERRGCELPADLIVLCRGCHARFHHKMPR